MFCCAYPALALSLLHKDRGPGSVSNWLRSGRVVLFDGDALLFSSSVGGTQTGSVCWRSTFGPSRLIISARHNGSFWMILMMGFRGGRGILVG